MFRADKIVIETGRFRTGDGKRLAGGKRPRRRGQHVERFGIKTNRPQRHRHTQEEKVPDEHLRSNAEAKVKEIRQAAERNQRPQGHEQKHELRDRRTSRSIQHREYASPGCSYKQDPRCRDDEPERDGSLIALRSSANNIQAFVIRIKTAMMTPPARSTAGRTGCFCGTVLTNADLSARTSPSFSTAA